MHTARAFQTVLGMQVAPSIQIVCLAMGRFADSTLTLDSTEIHAPVLVDLAIEACTDSKTLSTKHLENERTHEKRAVQRPERPRKVAERPPTDLDIVRQIRRATNVGVKNFLFFPHVRFKPRSVVNVKKRTV